MSISPKHRKAPEQGMAQSQKGSAAEIENCDRKEIDLQGSEKNPALSRLGAALPVGREHSSDS